MIKRSTARRSTVELIKIQENFYLLILKKLCLLMLIILIVLLSEKIMTTTLVSEPSDKVKNTNVDSNKAVEKFSVAQVDSEMIKAIFQLSQNEQFLYAQLVNERLLLEEAKLLQQSMLEKNTNERGSSLFMAELYAGRATPVIAHEKYWQVNLFSSQELEHRILLLNKKIALLEKSILYSNIYFSLAHVGYYFLQIIV